MSYFGELRFEEFVWVSSKERSIPIFGGKRENIVELVFSDTALEYKQKNLVAFIQQFDGN